MKDFPSLTPCHPLTTHFNRTVSVKGSWRRHGWIGISPGISNMFQQTLLCLLLGGTIFEPDDVPQEVGFERWHDGPRESMLLIRCLSSIYVTSSEQIDDDWSRSGYPS